MPYVEDDLINKVNQTAQEFSWTLGKLALAYDKAFAAVVRKTVFDLFASIIRRSPVDTGTYRASHGIANHFPGDAEGIVIYEKGNDPGEMAALAQYAGWTWKPGDGDIYIFNNLPYAEPIESGHSGKAPQGVYRQAMTEINGVMQKNISQLRLSGYFI